jgi:dihydroorotase
MTLYLTDNMPPAEIDAVKASGFVHAVKLYPAGATTNSDAGVSDLRKCAATLARMEALGVPLLVHGEVTDPAVDIFDREAVFIETVLRPLLQDFPGLKVVLEHITTRDGIDFVAGSGANVAGTLTAHHLLLNRNAIFAGTGGGGDFGQSEVLPRHRFRAPRAAHQGGSLRLRRVLHGECRHRTLCRGL